MVHLKAILEEGNLFEEIFTIKPFPFIEGNEETLQQMLIINFGLRTVWRPYENMALEQIARTLILNHSVRWNSYLKVEEILANPFNEVEAEETTSGIEQRESNRNDVTKVSAFNTSDLIDDGGSTSENLDNVNSTGNKTTSRIDKQKKLAYDMLKESDKNSIIHNVLTDVANSLTHTLY